MDEKRINYIALAVAGFAAVVSIACLVQLNRAAGKFGEEKSKRLELEQKVAMLEAKTEESRVATVGQVAAGFQEICLLLKAKDPSITCDQDGASPVATPPKATVPDELLALVGTPKQSADKIEVAVPGELTNAILSNIEVLDGEVASLEPALRNTKVEGLKLVGLKRDGLGPKLGLKEGDVVRSVNGMPFTSEEDIAAVFMALQEAGTAKITFDLRRDGKELQLVVSDPAKQPIIKPVP